MRLRLVPLLILCVACISGFAQQKELQATKVFHGPRIDGLLDDAAWQNVPEAVDFTQNFPLNGSPATQRTSVKIIYDDEAIYVGAFLFDDPALIRRQLTARDGEQMADVDYFSIFFDTYNDQQNGFQFLVTSANVQTDAKVTPANNGNWGNYGDKSWDAVWQSKTTIQKNGWAVEMKIPYLSLRFAKKDVQEWGLQLLRYIRRNSEIAFWNPVDPKVNGFINQFGKFNNIKNLQPPLRLSLSPYVSGGVRVTPVDTKVNKTEYLKSGGMDVKYGINESFTLDATLIPDFGQVISDNVVNNLTPYEQRFNENRPFFTEGTELFNKAGLFYSRRIGAAPAGYSGVYSFVDANTDYKVVKNPSVTQLYNAVKFSGRTKKKLGIGVFNAITAPMQSELLNTVTGKDSMIKTEPLTNYNILVLDQAFKGRSSVTFTNTNVMRNGTVHDANVSALDWALYNKTNTYAVTGTTRYSKTYGYRPYSSAYFMNLDTVRTNGKLYLKPYDGYTSRLRLAKISGNLQYWGQVNIESKNYDPNDLGYLAAPNEVNYTGAISYNYFQPTKHFINHSYNLNLYYRWLYQPYKFSSLEVSANGFWLFKNMWDVSYVAGVMPYWQNDYFELRTPGRFVKKPWYFYTFLSGSSDSRKRLYGSYELGFAEGAMKSNAYFRTVGSLRYRFSNQFSLTVSLERQHDKGQIGYAFIRESNGEPIIGLRDVKDLSSVVTGTYNFTPRMNLSVRTRHYWNRIQYKNFYNVKEDGFYKDRAYIAHMDENFNLFNVDAFFTWDFRAGSRVVAGWKNWLGPNTIEADRYLNYIPNFKRTFDFAHGNELSLRVIYFLDYNQLKKHKH